MRLGAALHVGDEEPRAVLPAAPDAEAETGPVAAGEAWGRQGPVVDRPHQSHGPHAGRPAAQTAGEGLRTHC